MGISLKPEHLKRYRDIAWLFMKYGRSDLVKQAGLEDALSDESITEEISAPEAAELSEDLEKMGPTFVKLAQLLSTRADLLPVPYLEALARLQDDVEPFSFKEVEEIVTEELGVRLSKAFERFEAEPIAAASLAHLCATGVRWSSKFSGPEYANWSSRIWKSFRASQSFWTHTLKRAAATNSPAS